MDPVELKKELDALSLDLAGKNALEVKTLVDAFEVKFKESMLEELKKGNLAQSEEFKTELKKVQDHADALDVKLQEKAKIDEAPKDELKAFVVDNFDSLKNVNKSQGFRSEIKAVGNMTLALSLTGDQPRTYRSNVADIPSPLVNFRDLVPSISIDSGTLTFPREGTNEGVILTQVEGAAKAQTDVDITMVDVNTDFVAGFTRYSKKMANNLPFLESFLPSNLRRKYLEAENLLFYTALSAGATPTVLIAGSIVERIVAEQTTLLAKNFVPNAIVVNAADYGSILLSAGPGGGGTEYSLPGIVSIINGIVAINGISVYVAPWMPADKYIIGAWENASRVETQGLGLNFFEQDGDNVIKNMITARIEAQVALAIFRPDAFIFGDFTKVV